MRHCVAQAKLTQLRYLPGVASLAVGYYQSQPRLWANLFQPAACNSATTSFIVAGSESAMSEEFYWLLVSRL